MADMLQKHQYTQSDYTIHSDTLHSKSQYDVYYVRDRQYNQYRSLSESLIYYQNSLSTFLVIAIIRLSHKI